MPTTARIIAKFNPQSWINDHAYAVDPEGEVFFDVTETILSMGKESALKIEDDSYESDDLRLSQNAPEWIRNWSGPFYVEVAEAIHEYFDNLDNASSDSTSLAKGSREVCSEGLIPSLRDAAL